MNKTIQNITERRSCREYITRKVSNKYLDAILEAGQSAPSAKNKQSARIICLSNKRIIKKLRIAATKFFDNVKDPFYGAQTFLIVVGDVNYPLYIQDGTCVLENMFIAATSLKLGSCWINCLNDVLNLNPALKQLLNLQEHEVVVGTCIVGYKKEQEITPLKPRKENFITKIE